MRKMPVTLILLFLLSLLSGCTSLMTGMPSSHYKDAPLILAYSSPDIIRDQSQVATLIVPMGRYGMMVDETLIKVREGKFNPNLRISQSDNPYVYIVDVPPGTHKLTVTYDAMTGTDGKPPPAQVGQQQGQPKGPGKSGSKTTVTGSYSGKLFSWVRTSETSHTLKGGEIYVVGLKIFTVTGEIDLYPLEETDRHIILETRKAAQF